MILKQGLECREKLLKLTFHVNAERSAVATERVERLILAQVWTTLEMTSQHQVEQVEEFSCWCKLIMPVKEILK